jgi:hypothetical protein
LVAGIALCALTTLALTLTTLGVRRTPSGAPSVVTSI